MSLGYPTSPLRWVLAPTDGCPNCLRRYNQPNHITADLRDGSTRCDYECRHCGHVWCTSWALELLEGAR